MIQPNNNLSVLPWYKSLAQQNARKWWVYDRIYPLFTPVGVILPFQILREHRAGTTISNFRIYEATGRMHGVYTNDMAGMITIVPFINAGYDVIVFANGAVPFNLPIGQYYAELSDGVETWYSDVFTVVQDMSGYLKIEWYDHDNFVMDDATIVYANPSFHNVCYLCAEIAKPEYIFNEEVIERDGFTFPVKQVSEKRYRFSFLASEYMLDVLRFVRMADYIRITKDGQVYNVDNFLFEPEWQTTGDVAVVKAEFETNTVAKKIGRGYEIAGDFNNDFNDDFNNQQQ